MDLAPSPFKLGLHQVDRVTATLVFAVWAGALLFIALGSILVA
ncbi:hypothetical protein [Terricaulis sp.]